MAEADVGDDVFGEDPTVNALQQRVAESVREGSRAVRTDRDDGERDRDQGSHQPRRRRRDRVAGAHRQPRARRTGDDQPRGAEDDPRETRRHGRRGRGRRDPSAEPAVQPHDAGLDGEYPQLRRRNGLADRRLPRRRQSGARARLPRVPRRRADLQRERCLGHPRRGIRGGGRRPVVLLLEGARRTDRVDARRVGRLRRDGPQGSAHARRGDASGRRDRGGGGATRSSTTSSGSPTTTRTRAGSPKGSRRRCPAVSIRRRSRRTS